jgi:ABC-type branched-subunit amino acid transport system substrate-binding protein
MRHRMVAGIGAAAVCAVLAACSGGSTDSGSGEGPVRIASVQDLTGGNAANALAAEFGLQAAVKKINTDGGIGGRQVEVSTFDAQSSATGTQNAIRQAIGAEPDAVTGLATAVATGASVIKPSNIPWVTPTYTNNTMQDIPFWLSTSPSQAQAAASVVSGLKAVLGGSLQGKTIGLEGIIDPSIDTSVIDSIQAGVEQEGGVFGPSIRDPYEVPSWSSQAVTMTQANPDAVVIVHVPGVTNTVVAALGVAGYKGQIMSTEGTNSETVMQTANVDNYAVIRPNVSPTPDSELWQQGLAVGANPDALLSPFYSKQYAAAFAIKSVLEKCGPACPGDKFVETVNQLGDITIPANALVGPLNFTGTQTGITEAQVWRWDVGAQKSAPVGEPFSISSDGAR